MKTQTGHTAAPWTVSETAGNLYVQAGPDTDIALVYLPYPKFGVCQTSEEQAAERAANAALIAVAPETKAQRDELLAALKKAVERMEAISEHLPVEKRAVGVSQRGHVQHLAGHLFQHAKIARAAIARAEKGGGK